MFEVPALLPCFLANPPRHRRRALRVLHRAAHRNGPHAPSAVSFVPAASQSHRTHRSLRCLQHLRAPGLRGPLLRSLLNYCRIQNLLRRTEFQFEGSRIRSQETTNPNPNPNPTLNPSESQAQSQNPAEIQSPDETPNSPSDSPSGSPSGSPSHSNPGSNPVESNANKARSEEAEAEDEEAINDIQSLLSLFHQNVSILNILESPLFEKLRRSMG